MSYRGRELTAGNYLKLDDIQSQFNGSTTTFNLTSGGTAFYPGSAFSIQVVLGGVIQEPESAYVINQSQITFAAAPGSVDDFFCIALGVSLGIGVPGEGTVTGTKLSKPFSYDDGLLVLDSTNNFIGVNSTTPTVALDVIGNVKVVGIITATSFSGTATSTTNIPNLTGAIASNNTTTSLGSFSSANLLAALTDETGSGSVVFATSPTLVTPELGAATATSLIVSGISTLGITSATNLTSQSLVVSGISTFTNGPILVGTSSSTGTASQLLQVTGGAYVSGNLGIGTINPIYGVHIQGTSIAEIGFTATGTGGDNFRVGSGSIAAGFDGLRVYDVNASAERLRVDSSGNIVINSASATGTASQLLQVTGGAYVSGNLGIGTTNPQYKLHVVGSFGATTKSFVIPHPTKPNYKLQHGSLEGPENGVYIRGRTTENIIELPEYWTGLVDEDTITVNLTPIGDNRVWIEEINNNKVYIDSNSDIDCFYTVFAERKDVEKLIVEIEEN